MTTHAPKHTQTQNTHYAVLSLSLSLSLSDVMISVLSCASLTLTETRGLPGSSEQKRRECVFVGGDVLCVCERIDTCVCDAG